MWRVACVAALAVIPLLPTARAHAVSLPVRLYVFAGQSNMVGYSTDSAKLATVDPTLNAPAPKVRFFGPVEDYATRWATMQAPTEVLQATSHAGFGPEISAAPLLSARHPQDTIGVVKLARNGTNLKWDWSPDNVIGLYPQLIDRVRAARSQLQYQSGSPVEIAGFFWMQGESDALFERGAETYASNLAAFIASARRDLRATNMPFVIGRIADLKHINRFFKYSDVVRRSQEEVARSVPHTYLISTDGLGRDPNSPFHFDTRGTVGMGRRFVDRSFPL
jgi:hypothetical protein